MQGCTLRLAGKVAPVTGGEVEIFREARLFDTNLRTSVLCREPALSAFPYRLSAARPFAPKQVHL
jgi:hypothetical protein